MAGNRILYLLILLGLLLSAYLTIARYYSFVLACPDSGVINCQSVITSPYSEVLGVPISVLGLILFLAAPIVFARGDTPRFLWSLAGAGGVLYSLGAMLLLGEICIYCLALDVVIVATVSAFYIKAGKGRMA